MGFIQLSKTKAALGIDITSTAIKVIELDRKGNSYIVNAFAVEPLPEGTVFEREIKNTTALADAIKRCVGKAKSKCKNVVIAVPDQAVVIKTINAPDELSGFDLENYVTEVAPNHIPYALDEVAMDFAELGADKRTNGQQSLQLVAAKLEQLEDRTGSVRAAKLNPVVVDVESFAYEHLLPIASQIVESDLSQEVVAFVDTGATTTQFNVLNKGRLVHSRSINFGGKSLTEDIMRRYGMSFPEAGRAKRTGELPDDYTAALLVPFVEQLGAEISRATQIYTSNADGPELNRILLCGGCAAIPDIQDTVQSITGLQSTIINPFDKIDIKSTVNAARIKEDGVSLVVAAGLALRGLQ